MERITAMEQIARFGQNDGTVLECECSKCHKVFKMRVQSLKRKNAIICKGCTYMIRNPDRGKLIAKKRQETYMKKYGTREFFQTDEFKNKSKKTCQEKYGCEYVTQSSDFIEKGLLKRHQDERSFNRKYFYNDRWFDSSWELAYYIWLTDSGIEFEYHPGSIGRYQTADGKSHLYFPDFKVNGEYQEIKGEQFFNEKGEPFDMYTKTFWWEKLSFLNEHKVRIIRKEELKFVFEYVKRKYGESFLKSCKQP